MFCVGTSVVGLWSFANVLQDLHDFHNCLQNLLKLVGKLNLTREYFKFQNETYSIISFYSILQPQVIYYLKIFLIYLLIGLSLNARALIDHSLLNPAAGRDLFFFPLKLLVTNSCLRHPTLRIIHSKTSKAFVHTY